MPNLRTSTLATTLSATLLLIIGMSITHAETAAINVAKTPTCGCCTAWIEHLEANGFEVAAYDVSHEQLNAIKAELDIDPSLTSCHTAMVDGYFIEGHVPASDIEKLLSDRPDARGLTVPGMPIGSPGMQMGDQRDPFETLLVHDGRETTVFNRHNQ